jgi:hypothetical protein
LRDERKMEGKEKNIRRINGDVKWQIKGESDKCK